MNTIDLKKQAYELRKAVINMIYNCDSHSGHFGGSLSAAEYIVALYWNVLNIDPKNPQWEDRDRVVFSKGHSAPIIYSALAYKGYYGMDVLGTYRNCDSILQGHPDVRKTPGLDTSSGSLGQGLSVALGMALACRHNGGKYHVYCVLSDGELHEGMVWEAMMAASHHHVTNITTIIDYNRLYCTDIAECVMEVEPLEDKLRSFGWDCITVDGHDIESILAGFQIRKAHADKPFAIICRTVKGKGVSFMENTADWHSNSITKEQRDEAIKQLDAAIKAIDLEK